MGDVINLRRARKRADREQRASDAEQNRILHGRSKAERSADKAANERAARNLDGHRRDDGEAG